MDSFEQAWQSALAHHRSGRLSEAAAIYAQIVEQCPDHAAAWDALGVVAYQQGRPAQAVELIERAIARDAGQAIFHSNLGEAYRVLGDFGRAVACLKRAIALDPQLAEAYENLGLARRAAGDAGGAIAHFERAIELRPDFAQAHYSLACTLLTVGDLERGWREYAWRTRIPGHPSQRFASPEWDGSPLADQTLYVYGEQGLGDAIQFVRYVPLAARRAGRVICALPPAIIPLIPAWPNVEVLPAGSPPAPCDAHVSLAGLPLAFGTTLGTVPAEVPYLTTDPGRVEHWRDELSRYAEWKVGVVWQGNPAYVEDRWRSFALDALAPVAAVPGVRLFSLQKGPGSEQLAACGAKLGIVDLGGRADNNAATFADTAAIMRNLDLVISCDTSCAHLAGALGVPLWLAVSSSPSWRWLQGRHDSPWYPTLRLFRQSQPGRWADVFERMAQVLGRLDVQEGGEA